MAGKVVSVHDTLSPRLHLVLVMLALCKRSKPVCKRVNGQQRNSGTCHSLSHLFNSCCSSSLRWWGCSNWSDCPRFCPQLTCTRWLCNDCKQCDDLDIDEEDVSDRCAKQRLLQLLIRIYIIQHLFRLHRQSMILSEACKATSPCAVALAIKSHAVYQQTSRQSS